MFMSSKSITDKSGSMVIVVEYNGDYSHRGLDDSKACAWKESFNFHSVKLLLIKNFRPLKR